MSEIKLSNKVYNVLKWVVTILLPALMTFLGVVLPSCNVSAEVTTTIVTIIGALATLIGTIIGISSANYNKGGDLFEDN